MELASNPLVIVVALVVALGALYLALRGFRRRPAQAALAEDPNEGVFGAINGGPDSKR